MSTRRYTECKIIFKMSIDKFTFWEYTTVTNSQYE
nr:MAG TPA: hypothetical protein [Caudoviricetes sp.]